MFAQYLVSRKGALTRGTKQFNKVVGCKNSKISMNHLVDSLGLEEDFFLSVAGGHL